MRLITGNALDAEKRLEAANELARRSNAGDLDADNAFNLMSDIAPELSIEEGSGRDFPAHYGRQARLREAA